MNPETQVLIVTALSIGFFHTLLGPDHYVPFIVMSKARKWSLLKTGLITAICGIGHVGSSILIGIIGLAIGAAITSLTSIESIRGEVAAWLMIAFGLIYLIWGIRRAFKKKEHAHLHKHPNGTVHAHKHTHEQDHVHVHDDKKEITPWILFTIFIFGPCEPFIPILLYPAAKNNIGDVIAVTAAFSITTISTMLIMVYAAVFGFRLLPRINIDRYMHAIAGGTIFLCGVGITFLGL